MIYVEEWINESREVRTSHLDLEESCMERGGISTHHRGILAQYLNTNIPPKIDLCHACNNDGCSNPRHLYWGTRKENVGDSIRNGTHNGSNASPWASCVAKHGEMKAREIWSKSKQTHWRR